jgi:NAD(P)-dependent dehydrogenase (short-subunit alcohol dehydrogenase family)
MDQRLEYTLVTGASSDIGEAVARRVAPFGKVILHGRDLERLQELRLGLPNPETHVIWRQNFTEDADLGETLSGLLLGTAAVVTGLIHCAGESRVLVADGDPAGVRRTFQVNYFSATAIIRVLLKKSVNRGSLRCIVFVSDIASQFGTPECGIYAATKGAMDSLSRSLAAELGPAVRVNSILSGSIQTRGTQFLYEKQTEARLTQGYLLGPGCADDIAAMAEYLISDRARWITGQQFIVDGGKTAH